MVKCCCTFTFLITHLNFPMANITSIEERLIYYIIIPHMILPYKTSIDKRLVVYAITRCYRNNEYFRAFAIAAGDSIKYQGGHMMRICLP